MATLFTPIWIKEGPTLIRPIDTVEEALSFLEYWRGERGGVFHYAKISFEKALAGEIDVDQARQAFWQFAEGAKILGESAAA